MPERGRRLTGKRAPRAVGDRAGDHQRQAHAAFGHGLIAGKDRGLGVEGIEYGLDEEKIGAAVDESPGLLAVGDSQFVEGHRAEAWVVDVRRQRGSAIRWSERTRDEAALAIGLLRLDRGAPG